MQYINLYQDQFKPQRQVPWLQLVVGLLLVLAVLMAGAWWLQQRDMQQTKIALQRAESQNEQVMQTLEVLQKRVAAQGADAALTQQLSLLRRQLQAREPLRDVLEQAVARESLLPEVMSALAQQRFDGLWLTNIIVTDGGAQLQLSGVATTAERIPLFVDTLGSLAVFRGRHFAQLQLQRRDDELFSFVLATAMVTETEARNGTE